MGRRRHGIGGLAYASQQSMNAGSGFITGFDFANGSMTIDDGTGATTIIQINDPKIDGLKDGAGNPIPATGRFSAGQSVNGAGQETQDRLFLEAETTDVTSPVDIYLTDVDPTTGSLRNRWGHPVRDDRREPGGHAVRRHHHPVHRCPAAARPDPGDQGADGPARRLSTGQYTAPVFEFIFPENVKPGDSLVPNDLWHLGFLRFGEGPGDPVSPSTGPLAPTPWSRP